MMRHGAEAARRLGLVAASCLLLAAACRARGLELGVDGGACLTTTPDTAHVTRFNFPLGYLTYEPAIRVGVPIAAHWMCEPALGVDEVTPHDGGHYSQWRARVCLARDLGAGAPERRPFLRVGPAFHAHHVDGRTRLQFGATAAAGLRIQFAPHAGARIEIAYTRLAAHDDLPSVNVYALHAGLTAFTR